MKRSDRQSLKALVLGLHDKATILDADNPELSAHHVSKDGAERRHARLRRAVRKVLQVQDGVGVHA